MIKLFKQKNNNKACPAKPWRSRGFSLVEVLVAISIFSMTIVTMMSVLGSGISDINYAKAKITAEYLAQEGIEYVRNKSDTDVITGVNVNVGWSQFKFDIDGITLPKANINFYPTNSDFSNFTRAIQATTINSDEVRISSTVFWTQPSGLQSITFSENLFNWTE